MQIVASTFIALAAIAAMVLRGPQRSIGVMLSMTPLGAAAAINLPAVGGASIVVADLATLTLFMLICLTPAGLPALLGSARPFSPGFWLVLLMAWCILSALFMPRLFAGETQVFSISRSANDDRLVVNALRPGTGNLTQLFRMLLGICLFACMATLLRLRPDPDRVVAALALATSLHFALGWLDVLSAAAGVPQLLDPIRTANYAILSDHYFLGTKRMIGGFPEASAFGTYSIGMFGFWVAYWVHRPGERLAPWMLAATTVVLVRSTSSAAYVAVIAFLVTWGLWMTLVHLRAEAARRSLRIFTTLLLSGWCVLLLIFAAYQLADPVTAFLDRAIFNKLDSHSGVERMSWNAQAWQNFLDTRGMGAGLGSVRASNWLVASLGSIGVLGTILFFIFLVRVATAPTPDRTDGMRATIGGLKAACLALLMTALLASATPDLGLTFFALAGMATGLSRGAVIESRAAAQPETGRLQASRLQ